jgi:hypothetical protein
MRILFVGDILGKPGRRVLRAILPSLVDRYSLDMVIGNVENIFRGTGVSRESINDVKKSGVHVMTSGNHIWKRSGAADLLKEETTLLRPSNYPPNVPGRGMMVWESNLGIRVGVMNLLGRVFMEPMECPFRTSEILLERLAESGVRLCIVDFHAEATSEKSALGWHLDGKVSAVVGTHTHVQTADERLLPKGTGFITDAGMTGAQDSVIGVKIEPSLKRFLTGVPQQLEPSGKNLMLNGVFMEICDDSGRCLEIRRVREYLDTKESKWNN